MKIFTLESLKAAPILTCTQLNDILTASFKTDHPLGGLVALSILAPAIADVISAAEVDQIDLRRGTVVVPAGSFARHEVALGSAAMDLVERLIGHRDFGVLIPDEHGDPIIPDADASDFAAELLADVAPTTGRIAWSLASIRQAAFVHMRFGGVSLTLLALTGGFWPMPVSEAARRRATMDQIMVADYWDYRLKADQVLQESHLAGTPTRTPVDLSFGSFALRELRP